jgi:hypothetical protein
MATQLLKAGYGKSHIRVFWSDDWKSKTPWRHNNLNQPYFAKCHEWNEDSTICLDYWYIGPIGIIRGKLVD